MGFHSDLMGSNGIYGGLMGSNGIRWDLPSDELLHYCGKSLVSLGKSTTINGQGSSSQTLGH